MNEPKRVRESHVEMTELVLPNDTNRLGNLLGGRLMHWMDIAAAMASARHANRICVTAAVDELDFLNPVPLGEVVILKASVNRVFRTSMEVGVKVFSEDLRAGTIRHTNSAYLTFVALDDEGHAVEVPQVIPETDEEVRRYNDALQRREIRLQHRRK